MTKRLRIEIATLLTVLFVGVLLTVGAFTHTHTFGVSAAVPARTATPALLQPGVVVSPANEHENHD
jgi:hypothetical protein